MYTDKAQNRTMQVDPEQTVRTGFFPNAVPFSARIYIMALQALGAVALLFALFQAHSGANEWWLLFLVFTAAASYLSVSAPRTGNQAGSVTVSLGDFFVFGAMVVLGPAAAALMGAVEGVFSSLKVNVGRSYKILFNIAQLTATAFLIGVLYDYLTAEMPPIEKMDQADFLRLFGLMLACALAYFLLNSLMVALAMFLSTDRVGRKIAWGRLIRAFPTVCVNACLVVVVLAMLTPTNFWLVAVIMPLILLSYRLTKSVQMGTDHVASGKDSKEGSGVFGGDYPPDFLPRKAKRYLTGVILISLPILLYCLHYSVTLDQWDWLYLAFLTVLASCFPLRIFSITDRIWLTLSDVFVFVAMFQFGPEVAVVVACLEAVTFNLRTRPEKAYRWLFNVSQIVLVAFIVGSFFRLLQGGLREPGKLGVGTLVLFLVAPWICGFLYYVLSSGLTFLAVAFSRRQSFGELWVGNIHWYYVSVIGAVVAALAYVVVNGFLPLG